MTIPAAVSCRKTPEIAVTCKPYFRPEIFLYFFRWFSVGKHMKLSGIYLKNPDNVLPEYCFRVPATSGVFPPEPACTSKVADLLLILFLLGTLYKIVLSLDVILAVKTTTYVTCIFSQPIKRSFYVIAQPGCHSSLIELFKCEE